MTKKYTQQQVDDLIFARVAQAKADAVYEFAGDVIDAFGLNDTYYARQPTRTYFYTADTRRELNAAVRRAAEATRAVRAEEQAAKTVAEFRKSIRDATKEPRK